MAKNKPKILLVFCGGTIAMARDPKTSVLRPAKDVQELLAIAPELKDFADVHFRFIANLDSTNIQLHHWTEIANSIKKNYGKYDGFVVTHGTDTMAYTASAIALAFQNLNKPIVFTGSQLPPDDLGSDARGNLVNAFRVAATDSAEVMIVFGRKILRGIRSHKWSEENLEPFNSPLFPELGSIGTSISFSPILRKKNKVIAPELIFKPKFREGVVEVRVGASLKPNLVKSMIDSEGCTGVIFQSFGAGNVPTEENSLIPLIKYAVKEKGIPVLVSTQCLGGRSRMNVYETGYQAWQAGAIPTWDMSFEGAAVKLSWCLAQTSDMDEIRGMFSRSYVGEFGTE